MSERDEQEEQSAFDPAWLLSGMRTIARLAQAVVMTVAVLVLVGWAVNIEVLRSMAPGLTAMNPGGTAVALFLAAGSLWYFSAAVRNVRQTAAARGRWPAWSFCSPRSD